MSTSTIKKQTTVTRRQRGATLAEVAALAGVSTVSASVTLNNASTGSRVSAATRERILEAAQSLNYTPNILARSLRKQKTHVIAFYNAQNIVFDPRYPFYAAILAGIQTGCSDYKKDFLVHANFQGRSDDDIFLGLHNGLIDGLVLYVRTVTPLVERLAASHLPVVTVAEEVPGVPYVGIDEELGGKLLARHLAEKGYKKILYRSTRELVVPATQQLRKQAFVDEATLLGLRIIHTSHDPGSIDQPTPEEIALILGNKNERPDAIACWGDVSADGMAAFLLKQGLRIPGDIALVGFDGLPSTLRPAMSLTTINAPWAEVASTAVKLLSAQCEGSEVPPRTVLPVELFVGQST